MLFTDLSSDRVVRAFINPYTLKGNIRDAGLTNEQFKEFL